VNILAHWQRLFTARQDAILSPNQQCQITKQNYTAKCTIVIKTPAIKIARTRTQLSYFDRSAAFLHSVLFQYCYYYYIHLTAFFQDNLGKLAPER